MSALEHVREQIPNMPGIADSATCKIINPSGHGKNYERFPSVTICLRMAQDHRRLLIKGDSCIFLTPLFDLSDIKLGNFLDPPLVS
jgi:hypothetical protein